MRLERVREIVWKKTTATSGACVPPLSFPRLSFSAVLIVSASVVFDSFMLPLCSWKRTPGIYRRVSWGRERERERGSSATEWSLVTFASSWKRDFWSVWISFSFPREWLTTGIEHIWYWITNEITKYIVQFVESRGKLWHDDLESLALTDVEI